MTILLAALSAGTAAAEEETDISGLWFLEECTIDDQTYDPLLLGEEVSMDFSRDGKVIISRIQEDAYTTDWSIDGDTVTVAGYMTFACKDGMMSAEEDGKTYVFVHEDAEEFNAGSVIQEPQLSDFDGTWTATAINIWGMQVPIYTMDISMELSIHDGSAELIYSEDDQNVKKQLHGALKGDTLYLTSETQTEEEEFYVVTDEMNLRLHETGCISYSDMSFPETETEEETEDDGSFAIYFMKQEIVDNR